MGVHGVRRGPVSAVELLPSGPAASQSFCPSKSSCNALDCIADQVQLPYQWPVERKATKVNDAIGRFNFTKGG
jgi:hypothetical protein